LLCVQWKTPDDVQRNFPKHVEFYCENKFEKLVHLIGFIIRIYHEGRSSERQVKLCNPESLVTNDIGEVWLKTQDLKLSYLT
jgi:hypothetical protein